MPLLEDVRGATTPVVIKHGSATFNLECALEKESELDASKTTEGVTYAQILKERYSLKLKGQVLKERAAMTVADIGRLSNVEGFKAELEEERDSKHSQRRRRSAKPITIEEVEAEATKRMDAFEISAKELQSEMEENNRLVRMTNAREVAYLVASTDIESAPGVPALSNQVNKTPEQLEADTLIFFSFSDVLLQKIRIGIEEALGGPLANPT